MNPRKPLDNNKHQQLLLSKTKQILDHETEHLPLHSLMKLEKARQQAIQQSASSSIVINNPTTLMLRKYWSGSLIALSMLVLSVFIFQQEAVQVESFLGIYADLELLSSQESLEFYEELDFYQWLETNEPD